MLLFSLIRCYQVHKGFETHAHGDEFRKDKDNLSINQTNHVNVKPMSENISNRCVLHHKLRIPGLDKYQDCSTESPSKCSGSEIVKYFWVSQLLSLNGLYLECFDAVSLITSLPPFTCLMWIGVYNVFVYLRKFNM